MIKSNRISSARKQYLFTSILDILLLCIIYQYIVQFRLFGEDTINYNTQFNWFVQHLYDMMYPANATCGNDDVLMLGQRRRSWPIIKTALFQPVVFPIQ